MSADPDTVDDRSHDYDMAVQPHDSHITITLSRESAEALHRYYPAEDRPHEIELDAALGTALGAQHEYDNSPELQALLRRAALGE